MERKWQESVRITDNEASQTESNACTTCACPFAEPVSRWLVSVQVLTRPEILRGQWWRSWYLTLPPPSALILHLDGQQFWHFTNCKSPITRQYPCTAMFGEKKGRPMWNNRSRLRLWLTGQGLCHRAKLGLYEMLRNAALPGIYWKQSTSLIQGTRNQQMKKFSLVIVQFPFIWSGALHLYSSVALIFNSSLYAPAEFWKR